jgi:hypothetical protein
MTMAGSGKRPPPWENQRMSDSSTSVEELKTRYDFGSLYLTAIPLNNMTHLLNEVKKLEELAAKPPFQATLKRLSGFLNDNHPRQLNDALAFVQLELNTGTAGWKMSSDRDGSIRRIPWTPDEVWGIAEFSDAFLGRLLVFEQKQSSVASGASSVAQAWDDMERLKKDPYIPTLRTATLARDFRSMIEKKSEELEGLRATNQPLYAAIHEFSTAYDRSVAVLSKTKALEPLRLKGVELCDAMEEFAAGYEGCLAMLRGKKVLDSLKSSAGELFKDLAYPIALEETGDETFIEICQSLTGGYAVPGRVITQSLRQLFGRGKGFLDSGRGPAERR